MHSPTVLLLFLLTTLTLSSPTKRSLNIFAASPPVPRAANSTTSTGAACNSSVLALAAGIQSNIADQNNELATVTALGNVLAQNPIDTTLYSATQASLLGFVTKGIAIRENNQKIAPAGNGAVAGLAIVATAQLTELNLTMSLAIPANGTVNVATANATVNALKGDFAGGIVQNMKNLAASTANCTVPAAATTASPATRRML